MSAGMMPALDLPGEARPGQFGPMMRVELPASTARAQNSAVSCTGMPSVITMHSGISASMALITADLAAAGGTKTTDTSAPVVAIVSATVPKTGTAVPFSSIVCPAFLGFVPPTTLAPATSIRAPCLRPSPPVIPWIMIRLSAIFLTATSCSLRGGQLGRAARSAIHRVCLLDDRQPRVPQDLPAPGGLVAVKPDDDRPVHGLAALLQQRDRTHDAVGNRVAGGDAAEDVHEHGPHRRVRQHDLESVGHHLGGRAAADVEEVRRLDAAELLAGVGHHIEGGHDKPRAVADDSDLAIKLDVVKVLLLGPCLDRVGGGRVGELRVVLAEGGVVVDRDLAVEREHPAGRGQHHRVDLDAVSYTHLRA